MDMLSKEHRSWNMSRIKGYDTKPERVVRSILHRAGYRFRLHKVGLPGKPDIVLPKYKTVIFVHGCFWHRHSGCRFAYKPKTREAFWESKFRENAKRDALNVSRLEALEWKVVIVWECELRALATLERRLCKALTQ